MCTAEAQHSLPLPRYHEALRAHLQVTEPELWAWFSETLDPSDGAIDQAELDLLKSTYRLDGDVHGVLQADATLIAGQLDLQQEVTLHQELHETGRNARVQIFGSHVHIVFSGDLLSLLNPGEQRAVVAHELAHVALLFSEQGAYRVLDRMVSRLADDLVAYDVLEETARRLRLHTEVFADALAVQLTGERDELISAIVKTESGIRNVDPAAYLRQAEEILLADNKSAAALTHPELHIRVACLAANAASGPEGADPELVRELIGGPDDLDRVDLLAQLRLQELTHRLLHTARLAVGTAAVDAHAAAFVGAKFVSARIPRALDEEELASAEPSVRFYSAAIFADLALTDGNQSDVGVSELTILRTLSAEAERVGVSIEFDRIVAKATDRTLSDVRKLRGSNP